MERTDFPALQTYRRVLTADQSLPVDFLKDLAGLFLRERRADEWALAVYLKAIDETDHRPEILRGIAACVRWISLTERNKPLLKQAYAYLDGIDPAEIKKMSTGFKPPVPLADQQDVQRSIQKRPSFLQTTGAVLQTFYEDVTALPVWIFRQMRSVVRWTLQSKKSKQVFTVVLLAGLSAAVVVLVINTVGHLVKTEAPVAQKIEKAPEKITDPFTLQVAAYLKLSHFPDKKSARDFGESLKAKGIIDDYYVANFMAPSK
jgi:hypothetical protein